MIDVTSVSHGDRQLVGDIVVIACGEIGLYSFQSQ